MLNNTIGFIIDDPKTLSWHKDTSIMLMKQFANDGFSVFITTIEQISVVDGMVVASMLHIDFVDGKPWYTVLKQYQVRLCELHTVVMRKDPPVNSQYIYATMLLDRVIQQGGHVVNNPSTLRSFNEKLGILGLSSAPASIVSSQLSLLQEFIALHGKVVIKQLDSYGGKGIFMLSKSDVNCENLLRLITKNQQLPVMAQVYIPEITKGDKRILIINGSPYATALVRTPNASNMLGNIDAGAKVSCAPLSAIDYDISKKIAKLLLDQDVVFAGIDIIGSYCTEINITSPTGVKELTEFTGDNIASKINVALVK